MCDQILFKYIISQFALTCHINSCGQWVQRLESMHVLRSHGFRKGKSGQLGKSDG